MDELIKQIENLKEQMKKLQIQNDTKSVEIQNLKDKLANQPLYPTTLSENPNEIIENENLMTAYLYLFLNSCTCIKEAKNKVVRGGKKGHESLLQETYY